MIEVKNLSKKYGNNLAVDNLSFCVEKGKIYGFLGPNGAGKSTTMNIITGCLAPTTGEVKVDGYDIFENPIEAKKCIGYLPEIPPLYTDMTPLEYLRFVASAKGVQKNAAAIQIEAIMQKTGLQNVANRLIRNLSKGYRQRVGIAQAMVGDPEIIILDEPTVGLDPKQIIEIRDLIKSLGQEHTVILSSHILSEIQAVCDYVLIISGGKLVASDTLDNIRSFGENNKELKVIAKCDSATAQQIVDEYEEITHYAITEIEGGTQMILTVDIGCDIREKLFFDFAGRNIAIINMSSDAQSLEEIYLKLTDGTAYVEDEYSIEDENSFDSNIENEYSEDEGDSINAESEDNKADEQTDEDDYTPMFDVPTDNDEAKETENNKEEAE